MSEIILTEEVLRAKATPKVFERGVGYYEDDSVLSVIRRGHILTAEVEGSEEEPYLISVVFDRHGAAEADCTCPYGEEWDGWCKHIVAALLFFLREPGRVEERRALKDRLDPLGREQLQSLLLTLTAQDPAALLDLEARLDRLEKKKR